MAVSDYSTDPNANLNISGINVAEGWPAANANNAFRQMMADIRVMYNTLPNTSTLVTKTGGVFTGNPTFTAAGGYHFNSSASNVGGKWTVQPIGGSLPSSPQNGDWLAEY